MKLLHVTPTYWPATRYGGTIRSVHGLCRALAVRGHDVHVFTTSVDGRSDSPVPPGRAVDRDGVKVWYFRSPFARRFYWSPAMAAALRARAGEFDALHLHSVFLWPTWRAAREARRRGVPYFISPRGMLVKELVRRKSRLAKTLWIAAIERANLEAAAAVHATSALEADDFARFGFRAKKVFVVPNGVDAPENAPGPPSAAARDAASRENVVLFIGRVNWKKGLDRLVRAVALVPQAHAVIAGNDEEGLRPSLEEAARQSGAGARVTFLGPVAGADKAALLAGAKVFALPSHSENFGNSVLEAMAAGCPVLVTPEVGLAEAVRRAGAGVVSEGSPEALAAALRGMLADAPGRAVMAANGRRAAAEEFSWDAAARRMEEAYREAAR